VETLTHQPQKAPSAGLRSIFKRELSAGTKEKVSSRNWRDLRHRSGRVSSVNYPRREGKSRERFLTHRTEKEKIGIEALRGAIDVLPVESLPCRKQKRKERRKKEASPAIAGGGQCGRFDVGGEKCRPPPPSAAMPSAQEGRRRRNKGRKISICQ